MLPLSISNLQIYIDQSLSLVERWIWPSKQNRDKASQAFYAFKAFPKGLKMNEVKQWVNLQVSTMSPFSQGDHYQYISNKGLHLWITVNKFTGIPETACQHPLGDGQHIVKAQNFTYRQVWKDGHMQSCVSINTDGNNTNKALPINFDKSWAVHRNIDEKLKSPSVWTGFCFFILLCAIIWWLVGYSTISLQEQSAEHKTSDLTETLGQKLDLQRTLRNNTQLLSGANNWHLAYGFLPETFSLIAEKLNQQGEWRANSLVWQNKTMEIELLSKDIDITNLVSELENIQALQQVSIRPHDAKDTWILEAKAK